MPCGAGVGATGVYSIVGRKPVTSRADGDVAGEGVPDEGPGAETRSQAGHAIPPAMPAPATTQIVQRDSDAGRLVERSWSIVKRRVYRRLSREDLQRVVGDMDLARADIGEALT